MEDELAQEDEISAIHSIYEEAHLFTYNASKKSGKFFVKISSPESSQVFKLNFEDENQTIEVEHLTPILIDFKFPCTYPSVDPPEFTLSCRWLSSDNLTKLCQKLDELWIENDHQCVLFTWISFLSTEIFDHLNIDTDNIIIISETQESNHINDKRAIRRPCSHLLLKDYDKDQNDLRFQASYFSCKVCFTDKLGKDCIKFNECGHVFCNECMKGYFESQIQSGDVNKLICPYEKCESQALQAQVTQVKVSKLYNSSYHFFLVILTKKGSEFSGSRFVQ
jgi:E3 ubiquitin-protein ligase RNF14